jgi:hypothetical protein
MMTFYVEHHLAGVDSCLVFATIEVTGKVLVVVQYVVLVLFMAQ